MSGSVAGSWSSSGGTGVLICPCTHSAVSSCSSCYLFHLGAHEGSRWSLGGELRRYQEREEEFWSGQGQSRGLPVLSEGRALLGELGMWYFLAPLHLFCISLPPPAEGMDPRRDFLQGFAGCSLNMLHSVHLLDCDLLAWATVRRD